MLGLLQRAGRRETLGQTEVPELSPHTTVLGHGKFPPGAEEFLGELPTQTARRHGDLLTHHRVHLRRNSRDTRRTATTCRHNTATSQLLDV
jgi:hypothetical protein